MVIKEAKLLFQAEALQMPIIKQSDAGDGWLVTLKSTHQLNPVLETAHGGVRVFKRLDVAVFLLFEIGVDEVKVQGNRIKKHISISFL
jgi:hypothetical protein